MYWPCGRFWDTVTPGLHDRHAEHLWLSVTDEEGDIGLIVEHVKMFRAKHQEPWRRIQQDQMAKLQYVLRPRVHRPQGSGGPVDISHLLDESCKAGVRYVVSLEDEVHCANSMLGCFCYFDRCTECLVSSQRLEDCLRAAELHAIKQYALYRQADQWV